MANIASCSTLTSDELLEYQDSVDAYRTTVAAFDFKYKQGIIDSARNMIKAGFDKLSVIKALHLPTEIADSL